MTAYAVLMSDWSSNVFSTDLTLTMEFAVGVFLNERAHHLSLQDDEARRRAEHLVIARKLLTEHPADERHALSLQLTTDRYDIHWAPSSPPPPALAPGLERMRRQIVNWEPTLEQSGLWLRLASPGRVRSEEHTSELQSLMRISYAVFCL